MNNTLLKKALAKINERRLFAEDRARENLEIAFKNEVFKQNYKMQKEEEIEIAKKEAFNIHASYEKLNNLKNEQEFLLKNLGLNGTDIKPNYECKLCNDTGFIKGKTCECLKKEVNKQLFSYSGFTHKLATFEDSKINNLAYDLMKKWCESIPSKINVLISGHTGTGKTYLTECIASRLMQQNRIVLFTTAFNLNNSLLNYHISFDSKRNDIIEPFLTSEVLIIDDLGSEPMLKNVTKEYLYLVISERMQNNLPTIITTNLELGEILATYGERIFSRLVHKKTTLCLNLEGEDLRLKK